MIIGLLGHEERRLDRTVELPCGDHRLNGRQWNNISPIQLGCPYATVYSANVRGDPANISKPWCLEIFFAYGFHNAVSTEGFVDGRICLFQSHGEELPSPPTRAPTYAFNLLPSARPASTRSSSACPRSLRIRCFEPRYAWRKNKSYCDNASVSRRIELINALGFGIFGSTKVGNCRANSSKAS